MSKHKSSAQIPDAGSFVRTFLNRPVAPWLTGLALLVLLMFSDVLFTAKPLILSQSETDLFACDVPLKSYGYEYLKKGIIASWNPHIWSGVPYFAGFDTGLLDPLNVVFLLLPFEKAMNLVLALHTWVLGAGMFFLCRQRGLHPLAGFLSGAVMMFSGAYFLHIYSGHPNNVSAMSVAPYLYLAVGLIGNGRMRQGWLVGSAALAMQLLSCQAQYVFYTCLGVFFYSLLGLGAVRERVKYLAVLAVMVAGAVAMAAVQFLPARAFIAESLRSVKGMPYEFAAMFSFPPENLITLLAPFFFGGMSGVPYWGRCYLWEMVPFISVTAVVLAIHGLCRGPGWVRRIALPMVLLTFVLALGAHTPLFRFLYDHVPGFNGLRGNSKFGFQTILFVTLVAGAGLDALIRKPVRLRPTAGFLAGAALLMGVAGLWLYPAAAGGSPAWVQIPQAVWKTGETYLAPAVVQNAAFLREAGNFAAGWLLVAAATLFLIGVILFILPRRPRLMVSALCWLAVVEVFTFARILNPSFNLPDHYEQTGMNAVRDYLAARPGDYRILLLANPNSAVAIDAQNIWGYGSTPLKRYVEFMGFTQGVDPDMANQYVQFHSLHRLYSMLRCKYAFVPGPNGLQVMETADQMPQVSLISEARVIEGRDEIFSAMNDALFEPRQTVILETVPDPAPVKTDFPPGAVKITKTGLDFLEIEAQVKSPAILLVTDIFTPGWRARALPGSSQQKYQVLPANYILRAIPLAAGSHRIRMEYTSPGFAAGLGVSGAAWIFWVALALWPSRGTLLAGWRARDLPPGRA
ncbi:MAG: hypothetical protein WCQ57_09085 [Verrucomicrobiota bacterium]